MAGTFGRPRDPMVALPSHGERANSRPPDRGPFQIGRAEPAGALLMMRKFLLLLAAAGLMLVAGMGPALAHAALVAADPADKVTVSAPTEVRLTFSEGIELAFSTVSVTGADGTVAEE